MSSAFLSEMLTKAFGIDWMRSGVDRCEVYPAIYAGDTVTTHGPHHRQERDQPLRVHRSGYVVRTQRGEPVTVVQHVWWALMATDEARTDDPPSRHV